MPAEKLLYTNKTYTTDGREKGAARSSDGRLDARLSMSGEPGTGTNPEQCWRPDGPTASQCNALEACRMKIALPNDLAIIAGVDLNLGGDGYFLRARLNASLPGIEPDIAKALIDGAHQTCPYSKATRGNIEVAITLI